MALEWLGYTDRESRDDKYRSLKQEGKKHVVRYTTHENSRQIIWVVCWDEPSKTTAQEAADENSEDRSAVS